MLSLSLPTEAKAAGLVVDVMDMHWLIEVKECGSPCIRNDALNPQTDLILSQPWFNDNDLADTFINAINLQGGFPWVDVLITDLSGGAGAFGRKGSLLSGSFVINNYGYSPNNVPFTTATKVRKVPAPLPLLGVGAAFGSIRKLRKLSSQLKTFSMI